MISPSVLLILYGATTSVSVVQLYAAAFIPGFLLAGFYILYVIVRTIIDPKLCPRPPELEHPIPAGEVFWALLTSFFPLAILILSVLGAIFSAWRRRPKRRLSVPQARCSLPQDIVR